MEINRIPLVILGPTASGKSDLALAIARRTGAEILSVDSMQVYRHMDIGTAKPSAQEQGQVRHHLIDLVDPNEPFAVAQFVDLAESTMADLAGRGVPVILTGGTPLYYKALFEGLFEGPSADDAVRSRLRELPNEELFARLKSADPLAAERIHQNDTRRLIRALEVHELTGRPISSFQTEWATATQRHPACWIGLHWDREALNRRINARVRAMLDAGWLDETRRLLATYGQLSKTAGEATGYRQLIEHLNGQLPLDEAAEQIKIETRQLARKQMKWFRRFGQVHWIEGELPLEQKIETVMERWNAPNA